MTSIEWLWYEIFRPLSPPQNKDSIALFEQAKEMHKRETIKFGYDFFASIEESEEELPLHPEDVKQINSDAKIFDNIEARIASYPEVEFEIVNMSSSTFFDKKFAKIIKKDN